MISLFQLETKWKLLQHKLLYPFFFLTFFQRIVSVINVSGRKVGTLPGMRQEQNIMSGKYHLQQNQLPERTPLKTASAKREKGEKNL